MTDKEIIRLLPNVAPYQIKEKAFESGNLDRDFIIYKRESIEVAPPPGEIMKPEDWQRMNKETKRHWAAHCTCSSCGEDFYTGWHSNGDLSGPLMFVDEDGFCYSGWTEDTDDVNQRIELTSGDAVNCPYCWSDATLIKNSELRSGRTYQILITSIEFVGNLLALVTWIAGMKIDCDGIEEKYIRPREAAVLMENGYLRCFSRTRQGPFISCERDTGEWRRIKNGSDPMQKMYYSYDSNNGRTFGSELILTYDTFEGTSAEKTGLDEYLSSGGKWPYVYLEFWCKHKSVENLIKTGFNDFVVREIDGEVAKAEAYHSSMYNTLPCSAKNAMQHCVDFSKVKPHEMLRMTKTEYRSAAIYEWTGEELACWQNYTSLCEKISPEAFYTAIGDFGQSAVFEITDNFICGEDTLLISDIYKYAGKQQGHEPDYATRLLIDYRRMLYEQRPQMNYSYEELWPRDIQAAHDRLAEQISAAEDTNNAANFLRIKKEYSALEWTDGELCIVLPSSNKDLVNEGNTLRHCVGGYGKDHLNGKPIFFVRHYRRPERSYYTLNENLNGESPRRIQLHGYGNEHHGDCKQYTHKIPQKVLDFCDRWEREILAPWFAQHKAENAVNDKKKKETAA